MHRSSATATPAIVISDATPRGDDVGAIALLASSSRYKIRALVATSGNQWAEGVHDALADTARRFRIDAPILCFPSSRHRDRCSHYLEHERTSEGLFYAGAFGLKPAFAPIRNVDGELARWFRGSFKYTVFLLGPASALAEALTQDPNLADRIRHVYVMGGCLGVPGNASPTAEFNFWFDPDAADYVLSAGLPTTLLPLDAVAPLSYPAAMLRDPVYMRHGGPFAWGQLVGNPAPFVCDEVLAAIALSESVIAQAELLHLRVESRYGSNYGRLTAQRDENPKHQQVRVVTRIDAPKLWRVMQLTMRMAPTNF